MDTDFKKLTAQVETIELFVESLKSSSTIPLEVDSAYRDRFGTLPAGFKNIPLATVASPSGGATVDTQARSAINSIIARLQSLGLIS